MNMHIGRRSTVHLGDFSGRQQSGVSSQVEEINRRALARARLRAESARLGLEHPQLAPPRAAHVFAWGFAVGAAVVGLAWGVLTWAT